MDPEDWNITDATTNMGEAQHKWSADRTGTHLSLVSAILEFVIIIISFLILTQLGIVLELARLTSRSLKR